MKERRDMESYNARGDQCYCEKKQDMGANGQTNMELKIPIRIFLSQTLATILEQFSKGDRPGVEGTLYIIRTAHGS